MQKSIFADEYLNIPTCKNKHIFVGACYQPTNTLKYLFPSLLTLSPLLPYPLLSSFGGSSSELRQERQQPSPTLIQWRKCASTTTVALPRTDLAVATIPHVNPVATVGGGTCWRRQRWGPPPRSSSGGSGAPPYGSGGGGAVEVRGGWRQWWQAAVDYSDDVADGWDLVRVSSFDFLFFLWIFIFRANNVSIRTWKYRIILSFQYFSFIIVWKYTWYYIRNFHNNASCAICMGHSKFQHLQYNFFY